MIDFSLLVVSPHADERQAHLDYAHRKSAAAARADRAEGCRETSPLDATQTARLRSLVRASVEAALRCQAESGIDVASDGEQGKIGYATYVKERLSGFDGEPGELSLADLEDYPRSPNGPWRG